MKGYKRDISESKLSNKLKIYFFSFIKKLYKPALIILTIQLLGIIFLALDNSGNIKNRIPTFKKYIGLSLDTYEIKDYQQYLLDIISTLTSFKNLERVDLSLSFRDKQKLDCDRQKGKDCFKDKYNWVKADFSTSEDAYKVKLRAKGDRDIHRINLRKMSFKVDIRGEKRFRGMEEFSIQSPIIRNYTLEALAAKSLSKENIITPRHHYIRLFINGEYVGVRHIEETISRELIEASKRRYGPVFSLDERVSTIYENSSFDLTDRKSWGELRKGLPAEALSVLRKSKKNPSVFNKYFDIDLWAKYMAKLDSLEMFHGTVPKSVKFFLNPITGLIEPIFFDGHYGAGLFEDFRLVDFLKSNRSFIDCRWTCNNIYFYRMMLGSPDKPNKEFLIAYLNALEKYTSKEYISNILKKEWEDLWLERGTIYREGFRRDAILSNGLLPHVGQFNKLNKRLIAIREDLNSSKSIEPIHSFSQKHNKLFLTNSNSRYPQIYSLFCNDKKLDTFVLINNSQKQIKLERFSECSKDEINYSIDGGKTKKSLNLTIMDDYDLFDNLQSNKKNVQKRKKITYEEGLFKIKDQVIIDNSEVTFNPGSRICLEKNSVFRIINSDISMVGNNEKPNIFYGCDNNGGSIILENSVLSFDNLKIKNLNSPKLKLRNLYGGINFINSKVIGNKINISNSLSEDAANFINSNVDIDQLEITGIKSDALDFDYSEFNIEKINCKDIGNDCIDLSYSDGSLNKAIGINVKDKIISLGENSFLRINYVQANNSSIGLVSKDQSKLFIDEYLFKDVSVPIAVFVKKPEFDPPFVSINKINSKDWNNDFISKSSKVFVANKEIIGYKTSREISNSLYGNLYGVKTER